MVRVQRGAGVSGSGPWRAALEARFGPGRVVEEKQGRPSVLEFARPGGTPSIVKLWWSEPARVWRRSAAARRRGDFVASCRRLQAAGLVVPEPAEVGELDQVCWVRYPKIPGRTLRELAGCGDAVAVNQLSAFLCELHDRGIHVRALNLGNLILAGPKPALGLLDVGGTRFYRRPLSRGRRARSLARLLTHARDLPSLPAELAAALVSAYAGHLHGPPEAFYAAVARQVRRSIRRRNRRRRRRGIAPLTVPPAGPGR